MEAYCHTCLKYQEMINPKEFSLKNFPLIMLWEFMGIDSINFRKNKAYVGKCVKCSFVTRMVKNNKRSPST